MFSDISQQDNVNQTECKRCGTCCLKGGPCLHKRDRDLVISGTLGPQVLVTFRAGELAVNPLSNEVIALDVEMIKIRGQDIHGKCNFLEEAFNSCSIYENRPLECRLLKCWDTRAIEDLFLSDLLIREDLMPHSSLLSELIEKYEESFPVNFIRNMCILSERGTVPEELRALEEEDIRFRSAVCESLGIDLETCLFFFGRPVSVIAAAFQAIPDSVHP